MSNAQLQNGRARYEMMSFHEVLRVKLPWSFFQSLMLSLILRSIKCLGYLQCWRVSSLWVPFHIQATISHEDKNGWVIGLLLSIQSFSVHINAEIIRHDHQLLWNNHTGGSFWEEHCINTMTIASINWGYVVYHFHAKIMKEKTIHQSYLSRAKDLEISREITFITYSHQHEIRYTKEHGKKLKFLRLQGILQILFKWPPQGLCAGKLKQRR